MSPAPVQRPPGDPTPLAEGETVLLRDRKGRRYLVDLEAGAQWHSHSGILEHDDLIGDTEGRAIRTTGNMEVVVLRPTRADFVLKMKRGAQVVYPKDQAMIMARADVRPGMTVVEAGAGSGALTLALLDAVGPNGTVVSFERRDDHLVHAVRNVERWHGERPANWDVRVGDVVEGLAEVPAHRVVLDMLEPWLVVDAAAQSLAPGGILLSYTPTVPQVMRFRDACDDDGRFTDLDTDETLVRRWDVDGLAVRPAHRMVAHTAFLTTARRVRHRDDGGPPRPIRKNPGVTWSTPTADGDSADED